MIHTFRSFVPYLRAAKERLNFIRSNHFERRTTREWQGYRIRLQLNFASTRWLGDAHFVVVFVTLCLGASLHPFPATMALKLPRKFNSQLEMYRARVGHTRIDDVEGNIGKRQGRRITTGSYDYILTNLLQTTS